MVHAFSKTFSALALDELYDILRVRAEIFVVEQQCFYLDPDGVDKIAIHVGLRDDAGALVFALVPEHVTGKRVHEA